MRVLVAVSVVAALLLVGVFFWRTTEVVWESFDQGFSDEGPLGRHPDWLSAAAPSPAAARSASAAGVAGSRGVASARLGFTWVGHPIHRGDPRLLAVTIGGDWQTDPKGRFDDDRVGWTLSPDDSSSQHHFGVQLDPEGPGGTPAVLPEPGAAGAPRLVVESYWDGEGADGKDAGRAPIVELPRLSPSTWYRLRARFERLTGESVRIDVTFVELDSNGEPTGPVTRGSLADTAALVRGPAVIRPAARYFASETVWPVFKNYFKVGGGFDNAFLETEYTALPFDS